MRKLIVALSLPALALPAHAWAHFNLTIPPATMHTAEGGKGAPPCGPDTATGVPTDATGGQLLKIHVDETVGHVGFYRIALSIDSRSELPLDNVVKDSGGKVLSATGSPSGVSFSADFEDPPVFPVLADHLWVHTTTAPQSFETMLTLPNVTCSRCTLQVIEFMANHGPNPGGVYFYHHCADLKITADPGLPAFETGGAGGAGATSGGSGGGANPSGGTTSQGGAAPEAGGASVLGGAPSESFGGADAGSSAQQNGGGESNTAGAAVGGAAAACAGSECLCSDDLSMSTLQGSRTIACAPYTCNPSNGACYSECTSIDDCSAGNICDSSRACVPSGSARGSSGGCRIAGSTPSSLVELGAFVAVGLVLARRRKSRRWVASRKRAT